MQRVSGAGAIAIGLTTIAMTLPAPAAATDFPPRHERVPLELIHRFPLNPRSTPTPTRKPPTRPASRSQQQLERKTGSKAARTTGARTLTLLLLIPTACLCLVAGVWLVRRGSVARASRLRAARAPWMVRYECTDGSVMRGYFRYPTREMAAAAAAKIGRVIVSGEERPVRSHVVVLDPARDLEVKKRKRAQSIDTNKSHAYCPNCHRRFYASQRACECGHTLGDNWEKRFVEDQGVPPEARPGAMPERQASRPTPVASDLNAKEADLKPVQAASHDVHLATQLRELADLHKAGDLSDAEFEQAKNRLIAD